MGVNPEDEARYAAVESEVKRRNTKVGNVVAEALGEWRENREDYRLLPSIEASRDEWRQEGGTEAAEFFRRMTDETDHPGALPG